ncbi:MAG: transcriptional regulator, partial [Sphingomonadaceae bacterium]|nr:transcriptional regulator [Sphingomonadaceae bacterium]
MSPAHVLEPTYRRLKDALLEGRFRAGTKLEAMRLADDFGVSMTPVRDSLNQLVGEGLVDLTPGEGFRVPLLTEQALRDILQVNALLLEQAPDNDHKSLTID